MRSFQSIEQQLILASYQLCTQIYPDSFLDLSLNQRQELQQSLRSLGKELKPSLLNILDYSEQTEEGGRKFEGYHSCTSYLDGR